MGKGKRLRNKKALINEIRNGKVQIGGELPPDFEKIKAKVEMKLSVDLYMGADKDDTVIDITLYVNNELGEASSTRALKDESYTPNSLRFNVESEAMELIGRSVGYTLSHDLIHKYSTINVVYAENFWDVKETFRAFHNGDLLIEKEPYWD